MPKLPRKLFLSARIKKDCNQYILELNLNSDFPHVSVKSHSSFSPYNGLNVYATKSSFSVLGASAGPIVRITKDNFLILKGVMQDFTESITLSTGEFK